MEERKGREQLRGKRIRNTTYRKCGNVERKKEIECKWEEERGKDDTRRKTEEQEG